ncbi:hypothetical protein Cflav_PD1206 [Pedosphaera parvula Ellin514]|uniref:Uncharacterized protein n=1 Tax=Pedosphaera parvula (strain Ellin514) TaxID=320771 RepID=B9XNQ6_PEDPL|nr:hypothetical protein Cflav_PD1206 [Pedosphaera parvula Ellin514]
MKATAKADAINDAIDRATNKPLVESSYFGGARNVNGGWGIFLRTVKRISTIPRRIMPYPEKVIGGREWPLIFGATSRMPMYAKTGRARINNGLH